MGAQYDLTCRKNQQLLRGWVSANLVWGFHLGTPCSSFTIARSGRPPPLRSAGCPLGLPNLSPADMERVKIGNTLASFSAGLLLLGRRLGLPCTIENPQSSRLWIYPAFVALAQHADFSMALTHMCMYGTPWKKATSIAGFNICVAAVDSYQCHSKVRGCCARTGLHHVHLRGSTNTGEWNTLSAQAYPRKMCTVLARCFLNALCSRTARAMSACF